MDETIKTQAEKLAEESFDLLVEVSEHLPFMDPNSHLALAGALLSHCQTVKGGVVYFDNPLRFPVAQERFEGASGRLLDRVLAQTQGVSDQLSPKPLKTKRRRRR